MSRRHLAFISYSHTDAKWCQWIADMLDPYVREGHLQVWADQYVPIGATWRREIDRALTQTRVAVLLVSAQFEKSPFICDTELPALLAAANAGYVAVVAIPVSASTASEGVGVGPLKNLTEYQWARSPRSPLDHLSAAKRKAELVRIAKVVADAFGPEASSDISAVTPSRTRSAPPLSRHPGELHDVPPLPSDLVDRPAAYERIKRQVLGHGLVGVTGHVVSVGVQGLAGVGKTVLAQAIVHDSDVRRSFPDGIYWLTVGQRADLWALQALLLRRLDSSATPSTVVEARSLLRQHLESRSVLLVLDDVWDPAHALAFDVPSAQSCVLITTRDAAVIRTLGAAECALDVFSREESLTFLAQRSGMAELPPEASRVADAAADLPLALAIAAGAVRDGRSWGEIRQQLEDARLTYEAHPFRQVFQALEASVNRLLPDDAARYLELAVFPEDEYVAEAVVQRYWAHTARLEAGESSSLLEKLHDKNLLMLTGSHGARAVSFHDLQLQFLRLQSDNPEALHSAFLDACHSRLEGAAGSSEWSRLPDSETYLWRHIERHLQNAGAASELRGLLLDPAWIEAKLRVAGIEDLLANYVPFAVDPAVSMVADTLRLAAHAIISNPGEVRSQLCGRLQPHQFPEIQEVVAKCLSEKRYTWLRPVSPTLVAPGGALRSVLVGHTGSVWAVAITPDGTRVISGASDHTLRVWDLATGRTLRLLEARPREDAQFWAVAVTPDGNRAVSADAKTLRVWDLTTGRPLHILESDAFGICGMALSPDGTRVVSVVSAAENRPSHMKVWDLEAGGELNSFQLDRSTGRGWHGPVVTPDGTRVVSSFGDTPTLLVSELASGIILQTFVQPASIEALALTPDGTRAVYGLSNGSMQLCDLMGGPLHRALGQHEGRITAVVVTPDGTYAMSASDHEKTVRVWNLARGHLQHTLTGHSSEINALAVTPDGARVVSASADATLREWDLTSGRLLNVLEGHTGDIEAVTVTPDGKCAVSASRDHTLRVWALGEAGTLQAVAPHAGPLESLTVTRDGRRAISAASTKDVALHVWDIETGRILHSLDGIVPPPSNSSDSRDSAWIAAVAVTSDGTRAVAACWDGLRVWDIASGRVLHTMREHYKRVTAVSVTRDGSVAVSASADKTLRVWDLASGHCVMTLEDSAFRVAVTPDGTRAATVADQGLRVWDLTRSRILVTAENRDPGPFA